jgi:branched-chain amino acid transport system ATP-binding protein
MNNRDQLVVSDLVATAGGFDITQSIDLYVDEGETIGLIGRNGAGKTTTFRAIMGLTEIRHGSITYNNEVLLDRRADQIPALGIGYQPEGRDLFTGMTVEENLRLPIWSLGDQRGIDSADTVIERIFDVFPEIEEKRTTNVENLSGGQAKMVSIGRALAIEPDLLILDEPLEGLAPVVVESLKSDIEEITSWGVSVLIAESSATHTRELVDRMYVIDRGSIVDHGSPDDLLAKEEIRNLMQG